MKEVSRQLSPMAEVAPASVGFSRPFKSPDESLGNLDADSVSRLMAAAADVSLIVDAQGVIRDLAFGSADLAMEGYDQWVGQPWAQTVTIESRSKVEAMLRDATPGAKALRAEQDNGSARGRWRHVNHPSVRGTDVPMMYSALSLGSGGSVIAFGRDLRATAELQQRLVDAQQAMERDYWRFRQAEARYRLLFEIASEAVLIIDTTTGRVADANPAAQQLLEGAQTSVDKKLVGTVFPQGFDPASQAALEAMLLQVRASGEAAETKATLLGEHVEPLRVAASLFRQQNASLLVVRLTPFDAPLRLPSNLPSTLRPLSASQQFAQCAPDAMVMTNREGKIQWANQAFVQLVQRDRPEQVVGDTLDKWLGRTGVDLSVLISNLRQRGSVKLFATTVTVDNSMPTEVEISAVMLPASAAEQGAITTETFGFTLRDVSRRLPSESAALPSKEIPRSVGQLADLVGRTPMKEIVSETTDLIEKLCIEAALELTGDNRAQAAEMLGLSRQSLYVKMRRFGVGDLSDS
jgi:transcriptional regulator PpsR